MLLFPHHFLLWCISRSVSNVLYSKQPFRQVWLHIVDVLFYIHLLKDKSVFFCTTFASLQPVYTLQCSSTGWEAAHGAAIKMLWCEDRDEYNSICSLDEETKFPKIYFPTVWVQALSVIVFIAKPKTLSVCYSSNRKAFIFKKNNSLVLRFVWHFGTASSTALSGQMNVCSSDVLGAKHWDSLLENPKSWCQEICLDLQGPIQQNTFIHTTITTVSNLFMINLQQVVALCFYPTYFFNHLSNSLTPFFFSPFFCTCIPHL